MQMQDIRNFNRYTNATLENSHHPLREILELTRVRIGERLFLNQMRQCVCIFSTGYLVFHKFSRSLGYLLKIRE